MEDEQQHAEIDEKRLDHFTWNPGDLEITSRGGGFLDHEGRPIDDMEKLKAWLCLNNPVQDLNDSFADWLAGLTPTTVASMNDELREELLDLGYQLPSPR